MSPWKIAVANITERQPARWQTDHPPPRRQGRGIARPSTRAQIAAQLERIHGVLSECEMPTTEVCARCPDLHVSLVARRLDQLRARGLARRRAVTANTVPFRQTYWAALP